jgi:DNA-binding NtrC family response regulator
MPSEKMDEHILLKHHRENIIPLVHFHINAAEKQLGVPPKVLSKEAEEYLLQYEWPGDVKELELTVKRACVLSENRQLLVEDFDLQQRRARSIGKFVETRLKGFMRNIKRFENFNLYDMVIPEVERALILMVMKETQGNQIKAAKLLGINRNTLRSKIKKLGIRLKEL